MKNEFVYSLRIGLCPDFYADEKFQDILDFCEKAKIDDVQFFTNMEEVNLGHPTVEEVKEWMAMIAKFKPQLEEKGVTVSLNPWTTTLHTDRGRKARPGHNFTLMKDLNEKQTEAVACPMDENFREYIKEVYGLYGQQQFEEIFIEDDFRLHNHAPLEWGGCFCELHRKEFSKRIGKEVTVHEMVDGMLKEGEPHPYRKVWLDTARDTMNEFSKLIADAIHDASPETRIGLMSSGPEVHCVEARDWKQVLANFSGKHRPLNRPHLPAYWESPSRKYALDFQRFSRLSAAMAKEQTELWPELDNLPHTTFSKSHRFASMEIESALSLCSEGITINIFDMIGNGINNAQKNHEMLIELKPYLNAVKELQMKRDQEQGVCVLYSTESSYTIHTNGERRMEAIQPWETFWAEYLSAFGIANHYTDDYTVKGQIVAVSGQYFRNLDASAIKELFANNVVLLEGEAVETLISMGLGELAGVKTAKWYALNGGFQSYEQAVQGTRYQNLPEMRIAAQGISEYVETGDYLKIEYTDSDIAELSVLRQANGELAGNGLTYNNNVIIFPYGHMRDQYNFLLHPARQEMFQELLRKLSSVQLPTVVENCQYITVNDFIQNGRRLLLLTNYSLDDFENISIRISEDVKEVFEISRKDGTLLPIEFVKHEDTLELPITLEHLKSRCIIIK